MPPNLKQSENVHKFECGIFVVAYDADTAAIHSMLNVGMNKQMQMTGLQYNQQCKYEEYFYAHLFIKEFKYLFYSMYVLVFCK